MPEILSVVPRTPSAIALKFFATWIPLRIIPLNYRRFSIPSCLSVSQKSSKSYSIFRKSLAAYCSWNSCLLALWLNPISIVILLASFVIIIWVCWFNMLRMLAILSRIIEFILPAWTSFDQELFLDQSNCRQLYPYGYSTYLSFDQRVCFWSSIFEIMISLHLSIELFRCFYNAKPLHSFFFWLSTGTHIRSYVDHQILCWILSDNALHIQ